MSDILTFRSFPKIPRWKRSITITEKIDGTNASVWIDFVAAPERIDGDDAIYLGYCALVESGQAIQVPSFDESGVWIIRAGSRNGFVAPKNDNYGFAAWVFTNAPLLTGLGMGAHYGEWWGQGIQRKYGQTCKRFSLFNTGRWGPHGESVPPTCCDVVPVLYEGPQEMAGGQDAIEFNLRRLAFAGSQAAPGYKNPEGVVVYHSASRAMFKMTIEGDDHPKGEV